RGAPAAEGRAARASPALDPARRSGADALARGIGRRRRRTGRTRDERRLRVHDRRRRRARVDPRRRAGGRTDHGGDPEPARAGNDLLEAVLRAGRMTTVFAALGVPIDSVGRSGGTELSPRALRSLGLVDTIGARDAG